MSQQCSLYKVEDKNTHLPGLMQGLTEKMQVNHCECRLAQSAHFEILLDNYFINTFGYFSTAGFITSVLFKLFFFYCDPH